jgi:hypothetical protein
MIRTFGPQTMTGSAQPLMSDVTTAAVAIPLKDQDVIIPVANSAIYQVGDRITLEPLTTNQDTYKISVIPSGGTTLQGSLEGAAGHTHASGVIIQLANPAMDVVVQPIDGGTGPVIIGSDNTVTNAAGGNAIYRLDKTAAGTQPNPWHMAGGTDHNICNTAEAWMAGTTGDKAFVYSVQI